MTDVSVEWLYDSTDCDTCGYNWADGARVYFDDKLVLDLKPVATCFDSVSYSTEQVFGMILKELGHNLKEINDYE